MRRRKEATVQLYGGVSIDVPTPGRGQVRLLSLDAARWIDAHVDRRGSWLDVRTPKVVKSGMSGSPIVFHGWRREWHSVNRFQKSGTG
jgi:hypothetical protein